MDKIDYRHHYVIVLDTETANTFRNGKQLDTSNALVYDCGWAVVDTKGHVYEERSFVNRDIFVYQREAMRTAYYADKIPQYVADLRAGKRKMANTYQIKKQLLADIKKYRIKEVVAHNARFDYNALNTTERYTSKSKYRYWFPAGIEIWDTMRMARDVILKMPTYRKFCEENNFFTPTGRLPCTAETLYRFIIKDPDFVESHTGLEDVQIEREILFYCLRQHKPMRKKLWNN